MPRKNFKFQTPNRKCSGDTVLDQDKETSAMCSPVQIHTALLSAATLGMQLNALWLVYRVQPAGLPASLPTFVEWGSSEIWNGVDLRLWTKTNDFFNFFLIIKKINLYLEEKEKKSHIQDTPTLSTDADSRTNTILERLHDLPIHTEKRTWSTWKCGLGPR